MNLKLFFLFYFIPFFVVGAENTVSEEEKWDLEKEELQVQETFPYYRKDFNHKSVQEEVYNDFLKELKEKEKSN